MACSAASRTRSSSRRRRTSGMRALRRRALRAMSFCSAWSACRRTARSPPCRARPRTGGRRRSGPTDIPGADSTWLLSRQPRERELHAFSSTLCRNATGRERRPLASGRRRADRGRAHGRKPSSEKARSPVRCRGWLTLEHLHAAAEGAGALQALDEGEQRRQGRVLLRRSARRPARSSVMPVSQQSSGRARPISPRRRIGVCWAARSASSASDALLQLLGPSTAWPRPRSTVSPDAGAHFVPGAREFPSQVPRLDWMAQAHSPTPHDVNASRRRAAAFAGSALRERLGAGAPRSGIGPQQIDPGH